MARRKKRGERHRWKPKARRAGTHAFVYPTSEEQEASLPPPGAFAGKYRRGDKVRFHPAAKAMLVASPIPIDVNAVMTIERIVPAEENIHADAEAAMLKLPSGMTTVAETDLLLPVGRNPRAAKHKSAAQKGVESARHHFNSALRHLKAGREEMAFGSALTAVRRAGKVSLDAEYSGDRRLQMEAERVGIEAVGVLIGLAKSWRRNPANIPGGSMTACIAIMEARPDVENAGALCNWLEQRAGESGSGLRLPSAKRKKLKPETRSIMRKLMKGT